MVPMPRVPRLPRTPACPECDRPGSYVWRDEVLVDTYVCLTSGCPSGEFQRSHGRHLQTGAFGET